MTRTALCSVLILAGCLHSVHAGEKLLICNHTNGTAELVDLVSLKSLAVQPVGAQPNTPAVTHDRRYALIASFGRMAAPNLDGDVAIFDLTKPGLPAVTRVSRNSRPIAVDTTPDSRLAIVGRMNNQNQAELVLIDLTVSPPSELGKPVPLPNTRSVYGIQVTPDGKRAFVLDLSGAQLTVVDLATSPPVILKQLATNRSPIYMRLSNDGRRLVVNNINSPAQAGVWNTESLIPTKVGSVNVGNNAGSIPAFEPGNRFALVASASSRDIHVVDAHSTPPVRLGTLGSLDSDLRGITATTSGLYGWVTSRAAHRMSEVDLRQPSSPVLTNRRLTLARGPGNLVAFGEVHAHGAPALGTAYPIFISSPPDPGKAYILGATFNPEPGFPIGNRTIPLSLDPLFGLSQTAPAVFPNFQGILSATGQAAAFVNIPAVPALRGFSFYVAGVIIDPSAPFTIGTVTNAEHVVIQ
jgi:hypothetical protein